MTTKVTIKNYQSIKDVSFEIDGFTVITGKNNIGKSAIIRALEAPLANQPGKSFIRHGEKKTTVKIKRDDIDVEWVKGASATYTIYNGKEKEVYSKLNRDVPPPLIRAGFGKMVVGDKKVFPFIASQFDELFLVDKPGSVVTEVLAELYNIDTLSKADDLCQKTIKSQKSMLKTREADLQAIKESLKAFADFEEIKETVAILVEKEKETENLSSEILVLVDYEKKIKELTESLSVLRRITQVVIPDSSPFERAINDVQWLREKEKKHRELAGIVEKLKGVSQLRVPKITKIDSLVKEVDQLCEWDDTATKLIKGIKQQKEILDNFDMNGVTATVEEAERTFKEFHEAEFLEEAFY
jgi:DNA repair ATPase RecN